MIQNWAFFIRFLIVLGCLGVYTFFLAPRQFKEVFRPTNWLTGLRIKIAVLLTLTIVTFIPSLVYLFLLSIGQESSFLRQITSIIGGVNLICTTILMVQIYTYRKKDEE